MAKLIHILAASVGGGLVLGASIRLGEAIGSSAARGRGRRREPEGTPAHDHLSERLRRLEEKAVAGAAAQSTEPPQWHGAISGVIERMNRQQEEMAALRTKFAEQVPVSQPEENLVPDLHRHISEEIDRRLSDMERKLHVRMETANEHAVSAMVASFEKRLAPRIDRLESEIGNQSAAVAELRDCSLQSERSIQRLLTVLERTLTPKTRASESGSGLSVMSGRGQDDPAARRPATLR